MSTAIISAQAVAELSYEAIFGFTPISVPTSRYYEVVQTTLDDLPIPTLNRGTLDRWGARYRPPQEWYTDKYDEDLFS
jgi:hypothetical protein